MIEKAYAKLNLTLDCLGKRADGFHDLIALTLPLELHDTLDISLLPKSTIDDFVVCDDFSLKISRYNLVHKMIELCREKYGFKEHLDISIHKNIYLQAGLGGGSADAAATFRAIIKLFKLNLSKEDIKDTCLRIGSDVYFQFYNHSAIMKGRGEELEFFEHNNLYNVLLIKPLFGNSTEVVFNEADNHDLIHGDSYKALEAFKNKDLEGLGKLTFNSLYNPAKILEPNIEAVLNELKSYNFEVCGMSGSGSTLYAISTNLRLLKKAEKEFYHKGLRADLTKILANKDNF